MTRCGLDVAIGWLSGSRVERAHRETLSLLKSGRLGLVTNHSAVTGELVPAPDALLEAGAHLKALFGPEHGVRGDVADGQAIPHGTDSRTGLKVWSLYGQVQAPSDEMMDGLEGLVFDIQDVGARFYTFSSTLSRVQEAAKRKGIPVIILDRPNPIGGTEVEGPVLEPEHASFVGLHPIPIRHAATIGEVGLLWAGFGAGERPRVIRCREWRRDRKWAETGLPWVPPSPNMPGLDTALVYPGLCLIEGTNLSEGRGTANPFVTLGAPWVDADRLAAALNKEDVPGARFRAAHFRPTASKYAGENCRGCQIHVRDVRRFAPVAAGAAVLAVLRREFPEQFQWRGAAGRFSVDRLAGTSRLRTAIDAGVDWRSIVRGWRPGETRHRERLESVALYD